MNADLVHSHEFVVRASSYPHAHNHSAHLWSRAISRRQFGRAALGTLAVGTAMGTGLWKPSLAPGRESSRVHPCLYPEVRQLWVECFSPSRWY
jgi:hypothetical protein